MSITKYADSTGLTEFWAKVKSHVTSAISGKQDTLVSGTNIKTINSTSLLGSGNIAVQPTLVSGTNIKTVNNESLLGSGNISIAGGGSKNIWYGTCDTTASTAAKVVTTSSQDFSLTIGNIVVVFASTANTYNGAATLNVDGTGAIGIVSVGTTTTLRYYWKAGEAIMFVYNGTNFVMLEQGVATTTYYGVTKLSSSTTSTSEALAATPKAVKTAYDLANGKQDTLVSGTNIKTINNTSLLGSGNITISAPSITYGTTDLTPGSSTLATGAIYLVYE